MKTSDWWQFVNVMIRAQSEAFAFFGDGELQNCLSCDDVHCTMFIDPPHSDDRRVFDNILLLVLVVLIVFLCIDSEFRLFPISESVRY